MRASAQVLLSALLVLMVVLVLALLLLVGLLGLVVLLVLVLVLLLPTPHPQVPERSGARRRPSSPPSAWRANRCGTPWRCCCCCPPCCCCCAPHWLTVGLR